MSNLSVSTTSSEIDDDLSLDEVISANPPMLQQQPNYQPFPLSSRSTPILVQRVQNPQGNLHFPRFAINQQPQWNTIQNQNVPVAVQRVQNPQGNLLTPQNLHLPRSAINQHPQRNVVQNQNVPVAVQRVQNPQGNLLPPQNLRLPRSAINQHPQRNVIQNQNVPVAQVIDGDASPDIQPCQIDRPIVVNGLYDPNFAAIGLPVDPFLRMFMLNPGFANVPKRK